MAFIDFTLGSASRSLRAAQISPPPAGALSPIERAASEIGSHDPLSSISEATVLRRWVNAMFAIRRPVPLADPKLEAIRRLAVAAHFGREAQLAQETRTALASGVDTALAMTILARFDRTVAA